MNLAQEKSDIWGKMGESSVEKLVNEAINKKIFGRVEYKGECHNPLGAYLQIHDGYYKVFILRRHETETIKIEGVAKRTKIGLIQVCKRKGNKYEQIFWREYAHVHTIDIRSMPGEKNSGERIKRDEELQIRLDSMNIVEETDNPKFKYLLKKLINHFNK